MRKIRSVNEIGIHAFGDLQIEGIQPLLKTGRCLNVQLPTAFEFNGDWAVTHECSSCKAKIQFGTTDDGSTNYVQHHQLKTLFSKRYSTQFLEQISKVLNNSKVFKPKESDWSYVVESSFNNMDANPLQVPKKTVLNYQCTECDTEYICDYGIAFGRAPERGSPQGRHHKLHINEIVEVDPNEGKSFLAIENSHRIN